MGVLETRGGQQSYNARLRYLFLLFIVGCIYIIDKILIDAIFFFTKELKSVNNNTTA